ncbi:MAG: four helix bundle protein [Candidatus Omnitrophica bacterium]|nr:four helix bundle protein [Candidatus Omnitrophota bacterium]
MMGGEKMNGIKYENIIMGKSFELAVGIVELYKNLIYKKKEYVLSKQLVKSGTSIGANVNEAQAAQSRVDFIAKMSIASKEARETKYWIELLIATNYLNPNDEQVAMLRSQIDEIIKLLTSIVKTTQKNKTCKKNVQK